MKSRAGWDIPRVLLADDCPAVLHDVEKFLCTAFEIVGAAQDGERALQLATSLNPNIIVLDISMPLLSGLDVASCIRKSPCRAKIIFLTVHADGDYVDAAFSRGASAYVLKCRIGFDLIPAIEAALQGHTFTSPIHQNT